MILNLAIVELVASRLTDVYDCRVFRPGGYPVAIAWVPLTDYVVDNIPWNNFDCYLQRKETILIKVICSCISKFTIFGCKDFNLDFLTFRL